MAAQTPEDMVRWIYTSLASDGHVSQQGLDFMSSPDQRKNYFTERMVAFYVANDSYGGDLARACVDFGFAVPGQDYDATEIARSLRLTSQRGNDRITVTAEFTNFGAPARVIYDFVPEAGYWKIDDIAGQGFRVSQINCSPKASATQPATVSQTAYCFQKGDDVLRLDLARDGSARLEFLSWQANGHTCSGQQSGTQVADGWRFPGDLGCQLQVVVTADGGVELKDPEWVCKTTMCGQRAVVDGLTFPHSSRVDCANWRGMGN
ncbi:MAG: hypothetical protein AAF999_13170 [Pseudomonadota bacterium]